MTIPRTTLEQWRVLQAIVEHGGFAQAAAALHRSQSSVSYVIARLQESLGIELLALEGRKARLTEAGRTLLARAEEVLEAARRLEGLAATLRQGWEPEVRLAVDAAIPTPLLLQALARFAELAPQTRLQLREEVLSGADEACIDGSADLVIAARVPEGHLGDVLIEVEFVAVAHPDHPLHRLGRPIEADDLRQAQQVVLRDSGRMKPRDEGWLGSTRRWTVTGMETALSMVAAGLGFAWLPCHLIQARIEAGEILPLPLREGQRRMAPLYLIFVQPELAGPATRQLAEVLAQTVNRP